VASAANNSKISAAKSVLFSHVSGKRNNSTIVITLLNRSYKQNPFCKATEYELSIRNIRDSQWTAYHRINNNDPSHKMRTRAAKMSGQTDRVWFFPSPIVPRVSARVNFIIIKWTCRFWRFTARAFSTGFRRDGLLLQPRKVYTHSCTHVCPYMQAANERWIPLSITGHVECYPGIRRASTSGRLLSG